MSEAITFYLPFGLEYNGNTYRKGRMHLATTIDELDIQGSDEVGMNTRYRDIMLLSKVIDDLDGLYPVTIEMIQELYEADFLYLQMLYKEVNGDIEDEVKAVCPMCHQESVISLPSLYQDMSSYKKASSGKGE